MLFDLLLAIMYEGGGDSSLGLEINLESELCLESTFKVIKGPINQIVDDFLSLHKSQVFHALQPLNDLLSILKDLFFDIINDQCEADFNLLELIDVNMTIVV